MNEGRGLGRCGSDVKHGKSIAFADVPILHSVFASRLAAPVPQGSVSANSAL